MKTPERQGRDVPRRVVPALAALLALGTGLSSEGRSTLLPVRAADVLLSVLVWGKVLAVGAAAGLAVRLLVERASAPKPARTILPWPLAAAAIIGTTAVGAALRFAPESILPFRLWMDTLYYARLALRLPGHVPWCGGTWFGDDGPLGTIVAPNAYAAWSDIVLGVFGSGEVGLLALSALPSIAAILAAAWLAAEIGGSASGVVAALLVSLSTWPIIHGRWGYTSVALVPLAVAGTAALVRAGRRSSLAWAVAGGAFVGATTHTYPACWPFLAILSPALYLAWRGEPHGRRLLAGAGAGALAVVLVVLPAWISRPQRVGGRAREVWIGAPSKDTSAPGRAGILGVPLRLAYNSWQYASLLAGNPDPNPRHSVPGRAPLHAAIGGLALVGATVRPRGGKQSRWILAGLAAGGFLAGVAASPAAVPNTQRSALFLMAALVLAAHAIAALPASRAGILAAAGFVAVGLVATDVRAVLGPWAQDPRIEGAYLPVEVETGRILSRLAPAAIVIEAGSVASPFAVETLAAAGAPRPIRRSRRVGAEDIVAGRLGNGSSFWIVARRSVLAGVDATQLRVGRGITASEIAPEVVVARGVRPGS
jgi:hypothetical protein